MKKFNKDLFNKIGFFLSDRVKVDSLESGAIANGGATKFDNGIYSNIEKDNFIQVKKSNNEVSIFIPSTDNVNTKTNNSVQVKKAINYLKQYYSIADNLKFYSTMGSWYSEDLQKTVVEDITIITLELNDLQKTDVDIFINLAEIVKRDMRQEGVSISINNSLAII